MRITKRRQYFLPRRWIFYILFLIKKKKEKSNLLAGLKDKIAVQNNNSPFSPWRFKCRMDRNRLSHFVLHIDNNEDPHQPGLSPKSAAPYRWTFKVRLQKQLQSETLYARESKTLETSCSLGSFSPGWVLTHLPAITLSITLFLLEIRMSPLDHYN